MDRLISCVMRNQAFSDPAGVLFFALHFLLGRRFIRGGQVIVSSMRLAQLQQRPGQQGRFPTHCLWVQANIPAFSAEIPVNRVDVCDLDKPDLAQTGIPAGGIPESPY